MQVKNIDPGVVAGSVQNKVTRRSSMYGCS